MTRAAAEPVLEVRATLGEGPVWDDREQRLLFVDVMGERVHWFHPESGAHSSSAADGYVGAVVLREDGGLVLARQDCFVYAGPQGEGRAVVEGFRADGTAVRFNDGKVDPWGRFVAGTTSWERVLEPLAGDRWRLARLTVNYRTPAEIMAATADLLAAIDPGQQPPQSVRETGVRPWRMAVTSAGALLLALAEVIVQEAAGAGQLAVIVPDARVRELGDLVSGAVPGVSFGDHPDLTSAIVLLGAGQAKGLEFDSVLIADPAAILAASPRGRNDLYVAMTRSTQRLGVLHVGSPPAEIAGIAASRD